MADFTVFHGNPNAMIFRHFNSFPNIWVVPLVWKIYQQYFKVFGEMLLHFAIFQRNIIPKEWQQLKLQNLVLSEH